MAKSHADLTGRWLGRYDYRDGRPAVPFEADLVETLGSLSGTIDEPNSFRPGAGPVLLAGLEGQREGLAVRFLKLYPGDRIFCPDYEGFADSALTRIEGRWWFASHPSSDGRFVMMRKPLASARAEKRETAGVDA